MTLQLASVPRDLQGEVLQQRYYLSALRLALIGRDLSTILEAGHELRDIAAIGRVAVDQATVRGDEESKDIARTALVQSLAASAGASLLVEAADAIRRGQDARLAFLADTRRAHGMTPPAAVEPVRRRHDRVGGLVVRRP